MIRQTRLLAIAMAVWSASVFGAQNGVAITVADGSMWQPSKDCSLAMVGGECVINSTDNDPYIISPEFLDATGPFSVELRAKSKSKGFTQIYWASREKTGEFSARSHVNFSFVHDNEWHDYSVKIEAPEIGRIRLDPSTSPGECRVAFVRIKGKNGKVVKEWKLGEGGPAKELPNAKGNAQIRSPFKNSEIVITTTSRLAGAIHSLTWNGQEFIDSHDHGRQLQSATNLDCGTRMKAETFNPTEAGSRDDGAGDYSTSRLLNISAMGAELKTTIQMAFWLLPGEKSGGEPAKNTVALSNHLVAKRVHIGHNEVPNIIEYDTVFTVPNEKHNQLVVEAVTGYMPAAFAKFYARDPKSGEFETIGDGPGEQDRPIVLATESGSHAMGIFAPKKQPGGDEKVRYGRFRFAPQKVVKWNCVFRVFDKSGIKPGDYSYHLFVVVGTLEDVKAGMNVLAKEFDEQSQPPPAPSK